MALDAIDWLANRANRQPTDPAIVEPDTDRTFTYAEFDDRASRWARYLVDSLDVSAGERIALLTKNGSHYFEVLWGCARSDTRYVGLNWRLTPSELEHHLTDASPVVLVYDGAFADTVDALEALDIVEQYVAIADPVDPEHISYEDALDAGAGAPLRMTGRDRRDTWGLLYTSGTTGLPKGVKQTFDMVTYNAFNIGPLVDLTGDDTFLTVLPCFHTGGLNLYANPTFIVGGTVIVPREFDPGQTLDLLEDQATVFFGVPAIYKALIEHPTFDKRDLSGVRSWGSGGARLPETLLERYAAHDIVIRQGMGMTETGPTVFLMDEDRALEKPGSIGKPAAFVDVCVVDRDGAPVGPDEEGELLIRGPGVTPGYWERPEANEQAFTDGWLHTGDVAVVDEDGYYYLLDRMKNMYISGGENVYPAEIERVLHDHPAIDEAAVVAMPDDHWGEVGRAFVVPLDDLDAEAVTTHCETHLAGYKVPRDVVFLDVLPRTPAGNVARSELANR